MNNYFIKDLSQTVGYLTASLIATALCASVQMPPANNVNLTDINCSTYQTLASPSTFDQLKNIFSGEYMSGIDPFIGEMSNLYERLLAHQERLEPEFETVLNENLWELYES